MATVQFNFKDYQISPIPPMDRIYATNLFNRINEEYDHLFNLWGGDATIEARSGEAVVTNRMSSLNKSWTLVRSMVKQVLENLSNDVSSTIHFDRAGVQVTARVNHEEKAMQQDMECEKWMAGIGHEVSG